MATYNNATNQVSILKELYPDGTLPMDEIYKKNPLFALMPKDESPDGFAGKYFPMPLIYGAPQGRSADFATAQTNQTAVADVSFFVYRSSDYQVVTITNELIEATKGSAAAFVDAVTMSMETGTRNLVNDLALAMYGNGDGSRGSYTAISTGVITLTNKAMARNFEVGMTLVSFSISGSTYTQSTSAALGYVIAVGRSAGTITVSATSGGSAGTPTNWSTSFPNIGVQGDVAFGVLNTQTFKKIMGLAGWIPKTSPSGGESFWGVDRSVDPVRLAGCRFDGSSESIEEALIDAASDVAAEGGEPEMCFMSFASYSALEKSIGSKVQYVDVKHDEADIAFAALRVQAPYGVIAVVPDRNCPANTGYLLQMDTWKLRSLNKAPHILTYGMEGLEGLRVGNADAMEVRIGFYGNIGCKAPAWNSVVTLSS